MLKALDLFPGGEKGVRARMAKAIQEGLLRKVEEKKSKRKADAEEVIKSIAKNSHVNADRLMRLYHGESIEELVDYELFECLEFPLDLSIHRVLGQESKLNNPQTREKWLNECNSHSILLAAGAIGTPRDKQKVRKEKELELYVTLRAIKELTS